MRSARSLTAIASLDIRSTQLRLASLRFAAAGLNTAREHFSAALALARNPMERRFLEQRVNACNAAGSPFVGQ
jgi:predicted RNA polymerase sigma factor